MMFYISWRSNYQVGFSSFVAPRLDSFASVLKTKFISGLFMKHGTYRAKGSF